MVLTMHSKQFAKDFYLNYAHESLYGVVATG